MTVAIDSTVHFHIECISLTLKNDFELEKGNAMKSEDVNSLASNRAKAIVALRKALSGNYDEEKKELIIKSVHSQAGEMITSGCKIFSLWLGQKVTVEMFSVRYNLSTWCSGLSTAGVGTYVGHVYTDDRSVLLADTNRIFVFATPVYCHVSFLGLGTSLGHFEGGGASIAGGTFEGSGNWKPGLTNAILAELDAEKNK